MSSRDPTRIGRHRARLSYCRLFGKEGTSSKYFGGGKAGSSVMVGTNLALTLSTNLDVIQIDLPIPARQGGMQWLVKAGEYGHSQTVAVSIGWRLWRARFESTAASLHGKLHVLHAQCNRRSK
eukprot:scpid42411/ scgid17257/ 